jgi:UrcA family protein
MKTLLIALVPALLAVPSIAQAEPVSRRAVAVSTAGLDVASATGAAELLKRVRAAAEQGCRLDPNWDRWSKDYDRCRTATVKAAVEKIDAPLVTALHRGEPTLAQVAAAK